MHIDGSQKLRDVMAEHPDLPVKVLAPSTPSDYDTYWHDVTGARVAWLLYPAEVQGSAFISDKRRYVGLNYERIYSDREDAIEDVAGWLFEMWFDSARDHGMKYEHYNHRAMDDALTEFCGYEYDYEHAVSVGRMAEMVAYELVENMPWHEYIIIDCY